MNSTCFVKTKNLTKIYATNKIRVAALQDVTLSISAGAFIGITGSSGSGKSTLMNLLGGLDTPTRGTIEVDGKLISRLNKNELARYRRVQVGMIFQSFNLISSYSAQENVAFPLLFAGVGKKQRLERAGGMLDKVGLAPRRDHRPPELSGGEQQRVAIARALINRPKMLLADEPTGNLDSKTSASIVQLLAELNSQQNITVVMISHEEELLDQYSQRMIGLCDGQVME
ncbi:MAG: ABC transporter ATP-binding protein [Planctomycetes bacterium]|nr:ABC transporter ATP-binding protein [Planctomycetota bacterium]